MLDTKITGASNIILNASGKINLIELNQAMKYLREITGEEVNIIWGTVDNINQDNSTIITLIATGMNDKEPSLSIPINLQIKPVENIQLKTTVLRSNVKAAELDIPAFLRNTK